MGSWDDTWYSEDHIKIPPSSWHPLHGAKKPIKMQLKAGYIARDIRRRVAHKYYSWLKVALTKSQQTGEINAASCMWEHVGPSEKENQGMLPNPSHPDYTP